MGEIKHIQCEIHVDEDVVRLNELLQLTATDLRVSVQKREVCV